jgi:methylated-DNA-protein-cysteine methyltransferase-like protein
MPKSPAFIRIRAQVLQVVASIPRGRVCTFQSIGAHLDVMPRHVAYILSQLDDGEKMTLPWHRVVAGDGTLGAPRFAPDGQSQAQRLAEEGVAIARNAVAPSLAAWFVGAAELAHGLPPQSRPATPSAPARRHPRRGSPRSPA